MRDKNDVDLEPLFTWGKIFVVTNTSGDIEQTVYIRLAGDADINRARVYALRKSAELRKKLRDSDTDERIAFIQDKELMDKDRLISILLGLSIREITRKSIKEVNLPLIKEPKSDASLEEFEKFQIALDAHAEKRDKEVRKLIEKELSKYKTKLEKLDLDALYNSYVTEITNEFCEQEMLNSFREMCTFFGTYKDSRFSERLFDNFETFSNLETGLKQQFLEAYQSLEIGTEDLKKSLVVTQ